MLNEMIFFQKEILLTRDPELVQVSWSDLTAVIERTGGKTIHSCVSTFSLISRALLHSGSASLYFPLFPYNTARLFRVAATYKHKHKVKESDLMYTDCICDYWLFNEIQKNKEQSKL